MSWPRLLQIFPANETSLNVLEVAHIFFIARHFFKAPLQTLVKLMFKLPTEEMYYLIIISSKI